MVNKNIFLLGVASLVLAFCLIIFDQRPASIVFLLFAAADFTLVFWTQKEGEYYSGKHAKANRWIDTVCVWIAAAFISVFDNWGGLVLFVIPAWTLYGSLKIRKP